MGWSIENIDYLDLEFLYEVVQEIIAINKDENKKYKSMRTNNRKPIINR